MADKDTEGGQELTAKPQSYSAMDSEAAPDVEHAGGCGMVFLVPGLIAIIIALAPILRAFDLLSHADYHYGAISAQMRGIAKFSAAAPAANGKIIFAPADAATVGVFDPASDNFTVVELPQLSGNDKFSGAVPAANGKIIFVPSNADSVGVFDPVSNSLELVDISASLSGDRKFSGAAPAANGNIIFAPLDANSVGVFTPATDSFQVVDVSSQLSGALFVFAGAAPAANGKIIFPPSNADSVGVFDPVSNSLELVDISGQLSGNFQKFAGAAPAANGKIIFPPSSADSVGVFDPVSNSLELVDISAHLSGNYKFAGAVPAANGKIIFVPFNADSVGIFDPVDHSFQLVDISAHSSGNYKFAGAAPAANGKIIFAPSDADGVGVLNPTIQDKPLLSGDQAVLGLMVLILWGIFSTESSEHPALKKFYNVIPSLLLCYFVPGICTTLNVINPAESNLYPIARDYLLPSCLVLLTVSIDLAAIKNLGAKAIIMFFAATLAVMVGGPLTFLVMRVISPSTIAGDDVWRGFTTLAGSWIGGGANQAAMQAIFEPSDDIFSKCVTVDALAANVWMSFLLFASRHREKIDAWLQADSSAVDALAIRIRDYQESVKRIPTTNDLVLIACVGFSSTAVAAVSGSYLAPWFASINPNLSYFGLTSTFFWLVVICTAIGLVLSFTPLRSLDGVGASKVGTVYLYILVTSIGMKMDLLKVMEDPMLFLVGIIWIFFIACVTICMAKLTRSPLFFLAVGAQANIGGAASAPVIAAAFNPALASVGVLLAVLGYVNGTYGALICGWMLQAVAPGAVAPP